jgi:hypothetical protein
MQHHKASSTVGAAKMLAPAATAEAAQAKAGRGAGLFRGGISTLRQLMLRKFEDTCGTSCYEVD